MTFKKFFWKRKLFFIEKIYILPNIEIKIKNFRCKRKILETEQKLESATGGGYVVLENFSIIKGCPENAYLLHRF